jgi:hypothetical protein
MVNHIESYPRHWLDNLIHETRTFCNATFWNLVIFRQSIFHVCKNCVKIEVDLQKSSCQFHMRWIVAGRVRVGIVPDKSFHDRARCLVDSACLLGFFYFYLLWSCFPDLADAFDFCRTASIPGWGLDGFFLFTFFMKRSASWSVCCVVQLVVLIEPPWIAPFTRAAAISVVLLRAASGSAAIYLDVRSRFPASAAGSRTTRLCPS